MNIALPLHFQMSFRSIHPAEVRIDAKKNLLFEFVDLSDDLGLHRLSVHYVKLFTDSSVFNSLCEFNHIGRLESGALENN
ncbi:hypothetical protein ABK905_04175 [Acerihabitans sp. KWT182]|uniref:Uncharacterized protein n=1 Tax=Acerihabitans sp. KWT182 TaxID=3157919 RepID=A0AAU7QBX6_9GAMM